MKQVVFIKDVNSLRPREGAAQDLLAKYKVGDEVMVTVRKPRNLNHHRKFFALVRLVFENQSHYESQEHMLTALKVALGHCDTVICKDGSTAYIPKSISFAKMDQSEFSKFYDKTLDLVVKHFLPGVTKEELRHEVETFL